MKNRDLTYAALMTALMCVVAPLSLPLPGGVPISLATLVVMLTGLLLKWQSALLCQIAYLLIGAAGLPVFAGFRGGLQVLVGVTGGFLWMYPVLALTAALAVRSGGKLWPVRLTGCLLVGHVLLYGCGVLWFSAYTHTGVWSALSVTVVPFLLTDGLKILAVLLLYLPCQRLKTVLKG